MRTGVGIVGCGRISAAYLRNASLFRDYEIKAVADRNLHKAEARGLEFGIDGCEVETRADIDIVLNLTPPAAHFPITMATLCAGKHVYSEKPLAATYAEGLVIANEAEARGLVAAVAPDTSMGASQQFARGLVDTGTIGRVTGGIAFFLSPGMEDRHPNAEFFFKAGGGPLLHVAPYYLTVLLELLGPVKRVAAMSSLPRDADHEGPAESRNPNRRRGSHHLLVPSFLYVGHAGRFTGREAQEFRYVAPSSFIFSDRSASIYSACPVKFSASISAPSTA
ncbi:Gfo/Idh/MocA family oxidoreductase [Mesorhizobium sp. M1076]|uniref:Gfo/Idh/MocA family protein n=1 Tax=Mesorhizobium sp. M1076 TaxID=2957054 RepID=UPI00333BEE6C